MSEPSPPADVWGPRVEPVYTNVVGFNGSAFDVQFIFGLLQRGPSVTGQPPPEQEVKEVARVSMSWGHAKSMIPLLAKLVADYEQRFGDVPAPGFDQNWKA